MSKKKGYPSGYYTSPEGHSFHALSAGRQGMSQETLNALGALADAAARMVRATCPQCGIRYGKGLDTQAGEDPEEGAIYVCTCGWRGKDAVYVD